MESKNIKYADKYAENRLKAFEVATLIVDWDKETNKYAISQMHKSQEELFNDSKKLAEQILDWAYGK